MNGEMRELISYRLQRAREALEAARLLLQQHHLYGCVNRLYYGCFYAVCALLLTKGLSSAKHTGVRALFNKHWIGKGILPRAMGAFYGMLFDARLDADYADMAELADAKVQP